ncbi:MAG: DUF389 domain-containing protein [Chloroflexota bacterium]
MKILEGQFPEGVEWRTLIVLESGVESRLIQIIGAELARANRGEVIAVVFVREEDDASLAVAREILADMHLLVADDNKTDIFPVIIAIQNYEADLIEIVRTANIDFLIACANQYQTHDYRNIPCAVGVFRTPPNMGEEAQEKEIKLQRLLIPTSAGPNSAYALGLLLPLTPKKHITAFYVVASGLSENAETLGHERLDQVVDFVDASERIEKRIVVAESVADGIVEEAGNDYDLVIIGASEESRLDQVIFGNIPELVIEKCNKPVLVLRRSRGRINSAVNLLDWRMQAIIPRKSLSERATIYARIRRGARPETSFFVLIGLSAMIASLGLIVSSPAVVIGAMLVAPLMSPIIGTGLALVLGDTRFLRLALGAVNRGVLLTIAVSFLAGLTALGRPFTSEILARTQPSLYDLGIALFSGAAAAYALSFSSAAGALPGVAIAAALVPPLAAVGITLAAGLAAFLSGNNDNGWEYFADSLGAILLFSTNYIAISTAAAFVFFILGFRPTPSKKARIEVLRRNTQIALGMLVGIGIVLGVVSYVLARENAIERRIQIIADEQVTDVLNASLDELEIVEFRDGQLRLAMSVFSPEPIPQSQVVVLQQSMVAVLAAEDIATDLGLTISVFEYTQLDPLVLPTPIGQVLP